MSADSSSTSDAAPRRVAARASGKGTDRAPVDNPARATYSTGKERLANILQTAEQLFIDEGMSAFSMRRLARELDISVGNLTYYYPSKHALLSDLMRHVIAPYLARFSEIRHSAGSGPRDQLRAVLDFVVQDLASYETTHFFPELWVLANRDEQAKEHMGALYDQYRSEVEEIIAQMRPTLSFQRVKDLALVITCSIEGHTMFVGHGRTHESRLPAVKEILIDHCVALVEDASESN